MRKLKLLALVLCLLVPGLLLAGPDALWTGADDTPNDKTGDITYPFQMCYDQPNDNWDLLRCTLGAIHAIITGPLGTQAEATSVATTPPTDAYYMVSRDAAVNDVGNPLWFQISQDGTNALAAAYPLPVSATMAANTLANPLFFQISADGTNAMDATHPLVISATAAANLTGNRIFVNSNLDQVLGAAINTNGGNRDAQTITFTLADDDPGVTAMESLDAAFGDQIAEHDEPVIDFGFLGMLSARSSQPAAVAQGDNVRAIGNLYGQMIVAGYQWASNAIRFIETNPLDTRTINVVQVDVTDYAETAPPHTVPYYSANTGYRYNSWQLDLDSDNGTVTATIECTLEPDCAPAACAWFDATFDTFGVNSLISAAAPAVDQWIDNDQKLAACTYTALVIVYNTGAANDDGDAWVSHAKWW